MVMVLVLVLEMLYRRHWAQRKVRRGLRSRLDVLNMGSERELGDAGRRRLIVLRWVIALCLMVKPLLGDGGLGKEERSNDLGGDVLEGLCMHKAGRIRGRRVWSRVWNGFIGTSGCVVEVVWVSGRILQRRRRRGAVSILRVVIGCIVLHKYIVRVAKVLLLLLVMGMHRMAVDGLGRALHRVYSVKLELAGVDTTGWRWLDEERPRARGSATGCAPTKRGYELLKLRGK